MTDQGTRTRSGAPFIGKYRVDREIGSGGMAVVIEATHVDLGQRVAIKLLDARLAAEPEVVARFLREARVAANLPSEHIAKVTDVGQTEAGVPYQVMELLTGHDLATELDRRGKLEVSAAVDFVLQACEGVAEAHAAGLVHRDLKPANLFVAQRGGRAPIVKVLDFGLSTEPPSDKRAMALTATGAIFGTPQYMSPEQLVSARDLDARSDQHALAMILFELCTGRAAYVAPNVTKLLLVIATQAPPHARALRPDLPAKLDEALVRALAKRPEQRFADLAGFATAIAPFGSAAAAQSAANVRAALSSSAPGRAGAPGEGLAAGPYREGSQPDLTSSMDPAKGRRRVRRAALAALAGAVAIGVAAGMLVGRSGRGPAPALPTGAATAATAASVEPPPSPPPAASTAKAEFSAEPASSAAPPPSGSAPGLKKPRPPRPAAQPGTKSALGVFGDRR